MGGLRQKIMYGGNTKRAVLIAAAAAVLLGTAAVAAYGLAGRKYKQVFFPNTVINGLDASGKTVDEVKALIGAGMDGYTLTIEERGDRCEQISGYEIGLRPEYDGTLETLLAAQNPWTWGFRGDQETSCTIETMMAYDAPLLEQAVNALECLKPSNMEAPQDACLSGYTRDVGYEIIPEVPGSTVADQAGLLSGVADAILHLRTSVSLEELGVYEEPAVTADSPELLQQQAVWNRYVQTTVTYRFGSKRETVDGSVIRWWLEDDGEGNPVLDEGRVAEYVARLAAKYNTVYRPRELEASCGETVTVIGGSYGWRINQSAETAALAEILRSGTGQEREPVYSQRAAEHDGNDFGDTYVEINLTDQHLWFYQDGELVVQSDLVSGNESKGWGTPVGTYALTYKQRNATLKGEGYATPVSYWMPFNGNVGMHDADWRGSFGGSIYRTGGSHGCINLPPAVAEVIYEKIATGTPIVCYHLEERQEGRGKSGGKPRKAAELEESPVESQPEATMAEAESPVRPEETQPEATMAEAESPVGPEESQPEATMAEAESPVSPKKTQPEATMAEAESPVSPEESQPEATMAEAERPVSPEESEPEATMAEAESPMSPEESRPEATMAEAGGPMGP